MAAIDNNKMMAVVCHICSKTAPGPDQMLVPLLKWAVMLVAWYKEQIWVAPTLALNMAAM